MTVVRDQLFPQKSPGSRFRFSPTGFQPSPGSSTIELPSAFAESGAYPPDRELPGSPRQCSLPLACRHPPEGHQIGARKRRTPENSIVSQPHCRRVSTDRPNREGSQLAASLEGEPGPTPAGKTLPHPYPETRFGERGHEIIHYHRGTEYHGSHVQELPITIQKIPRITMVAEYRGKCYVTNLKNCYREEPSVFEARRVQQFLHSLWLCTHECIAFDCKVASFYSQRDPNPQPCR